MGPWESLRVVVPAVGYGLLAIAAWIAVEARCVMARRAMAERKRRLVARSAAEAAPVPESARSVATAPAPAPVAGAAEPDPSATEPDAVAPNAPSEPPPEGR